MDQSSGAGCSQKGRNTVINGPKGLLCLLTAVGTPGLAIAQRALVSCRFMVGL